MAPRRPRHVAPPVTRTMATLTRLADEELAHVLSFLDARSVVAVRRTCRHARRVATEALARTAFWPNAVSAVVGTPMPSARENAVAWGLEARWRSPRAPVALTLAGHNGAVMALAYCRRDLLVTSSAVGDVLVWALSSSSSFGGGGGGCSGHVHIA